MLSSITKKGEIVSASSPLVGFGELNENTVKGLTSLLSVSKVQQESKLDGISHNVQMKTKGVYCYQEDIQARITILKKWFFKKMLNMM